MKVVAEKEREHNASLKCGFTYTLLRLRLNLCGQDLRYRIRVHSSTISRIFTHVIEVLFITLKPLIIYGQIETVLGKPCPWCFESIIHSVVIIDCFEIFLDRPTKLLARTQTYSSYKHHNTVKYLIGRLCV